MDHFRSPNNAFPSPLLLPLEHNWMQSDAGRAEFYAELARVYQHYFPSQYPPSGPNAAPYYEHSVRVRPFNNYGEPEEVD